MLHILSLSTILIDMYQTNISSFLSLQVAESDQATFTDLVRELTQNCVSDLEKAR